MSLSRRELLAIGVGGVALYSLVASDDPAGSGGTIDFESGSGARYESVRPAAGGVAINVEESDGVGTLAGGVEGPDGEPWALTCRHVVDPDYPDGDDEDVLGRAVYQPHHDEDEEPIGEVVDVGPSKGANSTDWAAIEISESDDWTSQILGLGSPSGHGSVETGDRVVLSGIRTGLLGAEITEVGVSRNWRGTLIDGMIGYRVDEDLETAGNSGAFVATLDSNGTLEPVGIHAFDVDGTRYAVPLDHLLADTPDISFVDGGSDPVVDDVSAFVEGAVVEWDDVEAVVAVGNIGGETVVDRPIQIRDYDDDLVDEIVVTLDPLEEQLLVLETPDDSPPVLDTGDVFRSVLDP